MGVKARKARKINKILMNQTYCDQTHLRDDPTLYQLAKWQIAASHKSNCHLIYFEYEKKNINFCSVQKSVCNQNWQTTMKTENIELISWIVTFVIRVEIAKKMGLRQVVWWYRKTLSFAIESDLSVCLFVLLQRETFKRDYQKMNTAFT